MVGNAAVAPAATRAAKATASAILRAFSSLDSWLVLLKVSPDARISLTISGVQNILKELSALSSLPLGVKAPRLMLLAVLGAADPVDQGLGALLKSSLLAVFSTASEVVEAVRDSELSVLAGAADTSDSSSPIASLALCI